MADASAARSRDPTAVGIARGPARGLRMPWASVLRGWGACVAASALHARPARVRSPRRPLLEGR